MRLEIGDIGVAAQEPDELAHDRFEMKPFRGDERKALGEIETKLAAKQRADPRPGAVLSDRAVVERVAHKVEIGLHGLAVLFDYPTAIFIPIRISPRGAQRAATIPVARSVQAHRLELVFPCVGDRRILGIGQHDRRSIGAEKGEQRQSRASSAAPGERGARRLQRRSFSHRRRIRRRGGRIPAASGPAWGPPVCWFRVSSLYSLLGDRFRPAAWALSIARHYFDLPHQPLGLRADEIDRQQPLRKLRALDLHAVGKQKTALELPGGDAAM